MDTDLKVLAQLDEEEELADEVGDKENSDEDADGLGLDEDDGDDAEEE